MIISKYENVRATPKRVITTWPGFARELAYSVRTNAKTKDGPAWSPTDIPEGCARTNGNVKAVTACVFDIERFDLDVLTVLLAQLNGYAYVLHSTFSHSDDRVCLRLILPVSRPILPTEYQKFRQNTIAKFGILCDPHTNDVSRIWYYPTTREHVSPIFGHNDGQVLDVDRILGG